MSSLQPRHENIAIGGTDVNSENIKNNDPIQLRQIIIFLKAELARHKYEVKKHQNSYHYSVIENLEQENIQLTNEKKELAEELAKLNQEFEKRASDNRGPVQLQGLQEKRYITSIDAFRKTKTDLLPISKQLTEVINKLKDGANTDQHRYKKHDKQVSSLHKKLTNNKTTIDQLENKLGDLIQEANKQIHSQLEKLDIVNKERAQSEKVRQRLLIKLDEKNNTIGKLQHEIMDLKRKIEKYSEAVAIEEQNLTNKTTIDQLGNKLVDLIQETNQQVHSQLGKLDIANKERTQSEKERQRLLIELDEKNNTIGKLQHEIADLKEQNEKHTEAIAMEEQNLTNKTIIAQLEFKLVDLIQEENKQVYSQLEKLSIANEERTQFEKVRERFLKEIEEKNNAIGKFQHEISNLKEQNEKYSEAIAIEEQNLTNETTIAQLEYKLVDFIQEENKQVHSQLEKLAKANKARTQFEKVRQRYLKEIEEKNNAIGRFQHEILNLKEQNEKYSEAITIEEQTLTNETTLAQLEYKLVEFIQEENKQVHSQLEKLDIANKERTESEKVRQCLLIEIEEKNNTIGKLQHEIADLKEQHEKHSEDFTMLEKKLNEKNDSQAGIDSFSSTPTIDTETLIQLDHQIKDIVAKSLDYEEKLDAKLLVVNTLEKKLAQLTDEIDGIKTVSVEGKVLKEF